MQILSAKSMSSIDVLQLAEQCHSCHSGTAASMDLVAAVRTVNDNLSAFFLANAELWSNSLIKMNSHFHKWTELKS